MEQVISLRLTWKWINEQKGSVVTVTLEVVLMSKTVCFFLAKRKCVKGVCICVTGPRRESAQRGSSRCASERSWCRKTWKTSPVKRWEACVWCMNMLTVCWFSAGFWGEICWVWKWWPVMLYITSPKHWYSGMRLNSYSCKSRKILLLLVESLSNAGLVRDTNLIWCLMIWESQQSTVTFLKNV